VNKIIEEKIKYLDHKVVMKLLASIESARDKLMFTLIYSYGLRVSELINLTIEDFDLDEKTIEIIPLRRKQRNKFVFSLSDKIPNLLNAWLEKRPGSEFSNIIVTRKYMNGEVIYKPISRTMVNKLFKKHCSKIGIPTRYQHPHTLRHSIALAMANAGLGIYVTKEFLRHTTIKSTEVYYHISKKLTHEKTKQLHQLLGL